MTDSTLFIGWHRPIVGRETQAVQLFETFLGYWNGLQGEKKIESFMPVLLGAHGGDLNGFMLINGTVDQLNEIKSSDKFLDLITECQYCVDGVGVIDGFVNKGVSEQIGRWSALLQKND
jgi:hypothetical protein